MDYRKTAERLIPTLGGKENIKSVTHCMTRLRFVLADEGIVKDDAVKAIGGVLGVMKKGGQYQVIIGNDVQDCYREVLEVGGFSADAGKQTPDTVRVRKKMTVGSVFNGILDAVSGSMAPILPAIIGCGMIKLLNIILGLLGVPDTNSTYRLLAVLGDAAFYFLPLLLAYTASKKFNCNTVLAITSVAVLLHPDLITAFETGNVDFLSVPVTAASYSSSVIPALLITWIQSYVERAVDKVTPGFTKTVFKPMIILLVMLPLGLIVLAPLGSIIGNSVQAAFAWMQDRASWLTLALFSAVMPFIVMTGMHYAFVPGSISDIGTIGYDTLLIPAMLASNLAQGAAALAVSLRSKNKEMKSVAGAGSASALIAGITEPALYGVNLRLKRPLIAACVGAGLSGLLIGFVRLKAYTFATPALISIIQFIAPDGGSNFVFALAAAAISIGVTFVLTLVLGFKDPVSDAEVEEDRPAEKINREAPIEMVIEPPIRGEIIPLSGVKDETFSTGVLGEGFAVIPAEGKVYAPFDGVCDQLLETRHALGLRSKDGVELLIHVGLETVTLEGKPFTPHVKEGERFKKGDLLLEFDIDAIRDSGCETSTPVIVTNADEVGGVTVEDEKIKIGG